ncbi:ABC transporter substrate-binding protein [Bradyrhizobium sp. 151]|uniref:ABC transporter substrate-binding protein n=1 Tax=Bradyrhizobium sp. 151 TaxID=2782626 RepID=UPI001FFAC13D|nr:ABC transporter substrate-binding protein [Bradyrhizobium sp. 151]MCK1663377.1 hypothetical protein [Bradyrhizobium sp. 151]
MAERWERINAQSLRLFLRKGVAFHDGTSLTAEDVAFSPGPDTCSDLDAAECPRRFSRLIGARKVDPFTFIVHAKGGDALLEQRLAAWGSEIVSQRAFVAAGSWERWTTAPIGSGPYKLLDHKLDIVCRWLPTIRIGAVAPPVRWHRIAHHSQAFRARERPARQRADSEKRRSI